MPTLNPKPRVDLSSKSAQTPQQSHLRFHTNTTDHKFPSKFNPNSHSTQNWKATSELLTQQVNPPQDLKPKCKHQKSISPSTRSPQTKNPQVQYPPKSSKILQNPPKSPTKQTKSWNSHKQFN